MVCLEREVILALNAQIRERDRAKETFYISFLSQISVSY